ncbi:hypothetical protein, partial [Salmonella sp. SAL4437]|uniref:CHASE3 domain-containing protein n=1 Tax=Salmonella sp. SAL4437 TaxID=3159892 RepID=UPI003979E025
YRREILSGFPQAGAVRPESTITERFHKFGWECVPVGWLYRVNTRLLAAFAVPLVVLTVVGTLAYRNTGTLERNSDLVKHTYQ